jgi:hypothetical protein
MFAACRLIVVSARTNKRNHHHFVKTYVIYSMLLFFLVQTYVAPHLLHAFLQL